jgi:hypothetical protein
MLMLNDVHDSFMGLGIVIPFATFQEVFNTQDEFTIQEVQSMYLKPKL